MKTSRKKLAIIRGGLPELHPLTDEALVAAWEAVRQREATLSVDARLKEQSLREAARAYDEIIDQLNELAHTLRHYRKEMERRGLA